MEQIKNKIDKIMTEELNMQEFAITEEAITEVKKEEIDIAEELANIDFSKNVDLDKYFGILENQERDKKIAEALDAEKIIQNLSPMYLDVKQTEKIFKLISSIEDIIKNYDVEKEKVQNMSETEKDKIFAIAKHINLSLSKAINSMIFSVEISKEEFKFIFQTFKNKVSYDGNDVLIMATNNLVQNIFNWYEADKKMPKDVNSFIADIDIKNLVVMYQFLGRTTVKGLDKEFYLFGSILTKIKEMNDVFGAYNTLKERISSKFLIWGGALTPKDKINDTVEGNANLPQ